MTQRVPEQVADDSSSAGAYVAVIRRLWGAPEFMPLGGGSARQRGAGWPGTAPQATRLMRLGVGGAKARAAKASETVTANQRRYQADSCYRCLPAQPSPALLGHACKALSYLEPG